MAADAQAPQAPVPPPVPEPTIPPDALAALTPALVNAIEECARKAAGDDRAAEVKDYGAAALAFAQTLITLDPSRLSGGDHPHARAASQPPQRPPIRDANRNGIIGG